MDDEGVSNMTMSHAATLGVKEQMATRIALFTAGAVLASWAPIVPYVKTGAALDDAALGLLLLCLGGGSIVAMPLSGAMAQRFGCRAVIAAGSTAFILMLLMGAGVAIGTTLGTEWLPVRLLPGLEKLPDWTLWPAIALLGATRRVESSYLSSGSGPHTP
mgnify:CR=1 FL=1